MIPMLESLAAGDGSGGQSPARLSIARAIKRALERRNHDIQ